MDGNRAIIEALKHQIDFAMSKDRYTAIVGGFGSGKSYAIPLRALQLIKRRVNKARVLVLSPTYKMSQDILYPLFYELLDGYGITYTEHLSKNVIYVETPCFKGEIIFRTASDYRTIKGLNVSDFIIDEFDVLTYKNQVAVWREAIARIRTVPDGTGAIVTTPEGYKYTYELFVTGINDKPPVGRMINAKSYDNPFTGKQYIEDLYAQFDKKIVEQYIEGGFIDINSMPAYYAWEDKYGIMREYTPRCNNLLIGMDFNVDPMCAVVGEIGPLGKLYIFDEIVLRNSNTGDMANHIMNKYNVRSGKVMVTIFPDLTSLNKRSTIAGLGLSDVKILRASPYNFKIEGTRISTHRDRLNTVNAAFSNRNVQVLKSCKELTNDFRLTARNEYGGIDKGREIPGKPFGHISDAAGYLIERLFPISVRNSGRVIGA